MFEWLGKHPPAQLSDWMLWGTESKTTCEITMPGSTPFGTTLWVAAAWLNTRLESGPLGDPLSIRLGGGVPQTVDAEKEVAETV